MTAEDKKHAQDVGIQLLSMEELESKGKTETFEPVTVGK